MDTYVICIQSFLGAIVALCKFCCITVFCQIVFGACIVLSFVIV